MKRAGNRRSRPRREQPEGALRWISVGGLVAIAAISGFFAWGPLSNLWGYQDSSTMTYVLFGGPFALVCFASLVALVLLLVRRL